MQKFYKKMIALAPVLLVSSILIIYLGLRLSQKGETLFPIEPSQTPWLVAKEPVVDSTDVNMTVLDGPTYIEYDFTISPKEPFSYTAYILDFLGASADAGPVDYSQYRAVSFRILCEPKNILLFAVFSIDDLLTLPGDTSTHRVSSTFFTCDSQWKDVVIDFDQIETPDWWLQKMGYSLTSDRDLLQDKISGFRFINSLQSPRGVQSKVKIASIKLLGENTYYIYFAYAIVLLVWLLYLLWAVRLYFRALVLQSKDKVRQNLPIVAYQKLSISPHKDKEKSAILQFMATQYSDAEINVESAIKELGLNRHKINELLKDELGLTFSSYLNKLRLTEAARLLSEEEGMNISEVAYAVGYNNVSYFSRLFKAEYGCSPKVFRNTKS